MGCILDEKHYEQTSENERWLFNLVLYSDPADEPTTWVRKQYRDTDGRWTLDREEGVYVRHFDREKFNEHHYRNFRRRFAEDEEYRQQYHDPSIPIEL